MELQTYSAHTARMVGITGKPAIASKPPMTVSEDGVERLRNSAQLWSAILSPWNVGVLTTLESRVAHPIFANGPSMRTSTGTRNHLRDRVETRNSAETTLTVDLTTGFTRLPSTRIPLA